MQEKARKHPQIYDRLGSLLGIEISQSELIKNGVEPDDWGWKEIERAKVDSGDIARASKEKGVRKSLISRIAGIFSREKDEKEK